MQHAVDAESDAQVFFLRFDMYIACARPHRGFDHLVDKIYSRLVVVDALFILLFFDLILLR